MSTVEPRPDLTTLRRSQDRQYEREGIAMYLALVDETAQAPAPDAAVRADGERVAARLRASRAALAAQQRDGDLGVAISLMQSVAHEDFDHSRDRARESA